jgi:uncharacterized protein YceH (UPF0502 family)
MPFELDDVEARVLGALIEKDMATPDYYPLSLNALVNACNQKSNRDPVMSLDQTDVEQALERLRDNKLALMITGADHRVPKHAHRLSETLNLGNRELAVLAALLLRGPQTMGELRTRTQSMHSFDDLEAVEHTLRHLMDFEPNPLVKQLALRPGTKEPRYAHLLSGEVVEEAMPAAAAQSRGSDRDRIAKLEDEVASLKTKTEELERQLADFRRQFE